MSCCGMKSFPGGIAVVVAFAAGMFATSSWRSVGAEVDLPALKRVFSEEAGSETGADAMRGQQDEVATGRASGGAKQEKESQKQDSEKAVEKVLETATFGSGCYWCTEAVFQRVKGVENVTSGFMGGHVANPTYEQVCTGLTGHAEVLQLQYDPELVTFEKLLEIFWSSHDPTTLNRQGNDIGPMYRSAVFYHSEDQKKLADKYKQRLNEAGAFNTPIVTEITKASEFYSAPDYHQDYYNRNKSKNPYCKMITYKLQKFRKAFKDEIDTEKDRVK
jgi:peptide-methionine (S)-S-oxide reductase